MKKFRKILMPLLALGAVTVPAATLMTSCKGESNNEATPASAFIYEEIMGVDASYAITGLKQDCKIDQYKTLLIPDVYQGKPVTRINDYAFAGEFTVDVRSPIRTIIIGNNITWIGEKAFAMCDTIDSVVVGSLVKDIRVDAFSGMRSLNNITVQKSNIHYGLVDAEGNYIWPTESNSVNVKNSGFMVKAGQDTDAILTSPCGYADGTDDWNSATLTCKNAKIPSNITTIGESFFQSASQLKYVNALDCSLQHINYSAFDSAINLLKFDYNVLPGGSVRIHADAFSHCVSLTTFDFSMVGKVDTRAFVKCSNMKVEELRFSPQMDTLNKAVPIEAAAFTDCYGIQSVFLPSTLQYIELQTFFGCKNLTKVVFERGTGGSKLDTIKEGAFAQCEKLVEMEYHTNAADTATAKLEWEGYATKGWDDGVKQLTYAFGGPGNNPAPISTIKCFSMPGEFTTSTKIRKV